MKVHTAISMIVFFVLSCACFLMAQTKQAHRSPSDLVFRGTNDTGFPVEQLRPVPLPDGRLLVGVADTVYMLDGGGKQLWKYSLDGATLSSEPVFNPRKDEVAVVGYDLLFVRLDANTGTLKWTANSSGRAGYIGVAPYGAGYVVVVDMSGYRSALVHWTTNKLEYWSESEGDFWSIDFPIGADLLVNGKSIYAVRHVRGSVRLRQLHPPVPKSKPSMP